MQQSVVIPCQNWAIQQNASMATLGFQMVAEWSLAVNGAAHNPMEHA